MGILAFICNFILAAAAGAGATWIVRSKQARHFIVEKAFERSSQYCDNDEAENKLPAKTPKIIYDNGTAKEPQKQTDEHNCDAFMEKLKDSICDDTYSIRAVELFKYIISNKDKTFFHQIDCIVLNKRGMQFLSVQKTHAGGMNKSLYILFDEYISKVSDYALTMHVIAVLSVFLLDVFFVFILST